MLLYWGLMGAGFAAAVVIGSLAWYASKRPAGWEGAATPGWVEKLGVEKIRAAAGTQAE